MASGESSEFRREREDSGGAVIISGDKISTIIPRRIFVGGFAADTTEEDLRGFFENIGRVKDVKIIVDKSGLSKGSYGFVTFESQDIAEKIIAEQAESLVFRDRKLNIGRAVKKQPLIAKSELQNTVLFNPLTLAYNPMYAYQDYSYLLNQDLSNFYQNYAAMFPQLPLLPSLFSPLLGGGDALGLSLGQYAQSLFPFSMNGSFSTFPSCSTPPSSSSDINPVSLTDPYSLSTLLSTSSSDLSTSAFIEAASKPSEDLTTSSPIPGEISTSDIKTECKISPKMPFTAITNQCKISHRDNSEQSDQPKKRAKYDESVTCSAAPVRYLFPGKH